MCEISSFFLCERGGGWCGAGSAGRCADTGAMGWSLRFATCHVLAGGRRARELLVVRPTSSKYRVSDHVGVCVGLRGGLVLQLC